MSLNTYKNMDEVKAIIVASDSNYNPLWTCKMVKWEENPYFKMVHCNQKKKKPWTAPHLIFIQNYSSIIHPLSIFLKNPKLWARYESIDLSFSFDWIDHFWKFHIFIHKFVDFSSSSRLKAHVIAFLQSSIFRSKRFKTPKNIFEYVFDY